MDGHEHPDWTAEVGQRLGQGLAVLATLSEAAARLAAEEIRRRERSEEQADRQRDDAQRADVHADQLARRAAQLRAQQDRRVIAQALDPEWLARADLLDLATVWRTARLREHEFPEARAAAETVEERLREMYPRAMDLYDQAVRDGVPRADAMRTAAERMAQTPPMRPHSGRNSAAIPSAEDVVMGADAFETALSNEQARLAAGVDVQAYTAELERLGVGGSAAAEALRETLAARAGQELHQARNDAATPDNPATNRIDEHTAVGMPRAAEDLGGANRDEAIANTRTAAQLAAEWYPEGLHHPNAMPAVVASKKPAKASATQTPTRAAVRGR